MNSLRKALYTTFVFIVANLLLCFTLAKSDKDKCSWEHYASLRKADYVYTQACVANALDSFDLSYRLADYASSLNPKDIDIASMAAILKLPATNDSLEVERIYHLTLSQYFAHPEDYENGVFTANLAKELRHYDDMTRVWEILDSIYPARQNVAPMLASSYLVQYLMGDSSAYNRAIGIYQRLERGMGKDLGLSSYKIRAMQLRHDTAGIIAEVNALTNAMPHESNAWLLAGQTYQSMSIDSVKELEFFQRACLVDSTNGHAFIAMAGYYEAHGDSIEYNRELRKALLSTNLDYETKKDLLSSYMRVNINDSNAWGEIRQTFDSLMLVNPGESHVHAGYAVFLEYIDEKKEALEQFTYALNLDPTDEQVRSALVSQQMANNDTVAAINTCKDGMAISPNNLIFPIMASSLLSQQNRFAEAFAVIDSTDISDVKNPQAVATFLSTAGDVYQMADSVILALETYDRAIALAPDYALAYNNASYCMSTHDIDLDKALRYARYAVLYEVDNPTYLDTYAWAYFKLKNYPEARSYIDKALYYANLMTKNSDTTAHTLSDSTIENEFVQKKDSIRADELNIIADDNIESDKASPNYTDTNSNVNSDTIDDETQIYGGAADVLEHAGDIYFMSGLPDQAVEFWERAAKLAPENELLARKVKNKTYFYK